MYIHVFFFIYLVFRRLWNSVLQRKDWSKYNVKYASFIRNSKDNLFTFFIGMYNMRNIFTWFSILVELSILWPCVINTPTQETKLAHHVRVKRGWSWEPLYVTEEQEVKKPMYVGQVSHIKISFQYSDTSYKKITCMCIYLPYHWPLLLLLWMIKKKIPSKSIHKTIARVLNCSKCSSYSCVLQAFRQSMCCFMLPI